LLFLEPLQYNSNGTSYNKNVRTSHIEYSKFNFSNDGLFTIFSYVKIFRNGTVNAHSWPQAFN